MMDSYEDRLSHDWSDDWDTLPEAPPLVPRSKAAQVTLRISPLLFARIKRIAKMRTIPYHALARSWLIDAASSNEVIEGIAVDPNMQSEQLNIKLDQDILDRLKRRAHELRTPYHRFAREWLIMEASRIEATLGLRPIEESQPSLKELMMYLLHAANRHGQTAIEGATRLQKLMFVVEQTLATKTSFYAYNFGPFNEGIYDEAEALRIAGFMRGATSSSGEMPTFEEMQSVVANRVSAASDDKIFDLTPEGHALAEELRHRDEHHESVYEVVASVREEWDVPNLTDLVDKVYATYPKFTEKSRIRDEVAIRNRSRRPDQS
jgi:predicted DNA binding CopG/RHH family protein